MKTGGFSGRVALVTGSSRGIGLAIARELAQQGATVVLNGHNRERLERAHRALQDDGLTATAVHADVTIPEACQDMIATVVDRHDRLDILVNNAGVVMQARLQTLGPEVCKEVVDLDLLGCIYPTLFAIPQLATSRGSVVYISSIAGLVGLPGASVYCAVKAALTGLSSSLRCELDADGIHVGIAYVGFTENDPAKTVIGDGGDRVPPTRPLHHTQADVARRVATLIRKRKRQIVLTPLGWLACIAERLSPALVEKLIVLGQRHGLAERMGVR